MAFLTRWSSGTIVVITMHIHSFETIKIKIRHSVRGAVWVTAISVAARIYSGEMHILNVDTPSVFDWRGMRIFVVFLTRNCMMCVS